MKLQNAQATQHGDNGDWVVTTPGGEEIARLPGRLTPAEAMAIIHFGRAAERRGFAAGSTPPGENTTPSPLPAKGH